MYTEDIFKCGTGRQREEEKKERKIVNNNEVYLYRNKTQGNMLKT
jgi:hypothetical protein